jgi:transposase InsO family protein
VDEDALTVASDALARKFGRYGYRRITDLVQMAGWPVNAKRVQRIWRAVGLKVPAKATQEREVVARRRLLHPSAARALQLCLGV